MLVKYSIQHRPGVKHGNADALSRRPDPEETGGSSKVTRLGHSEEDDDSRGSWSGEEPAFAAPEYGDTEHGGRAGEAPKDPVVWEVTPNVTSECGEQWADPGHGWCRVAGTDEAGPGVEPRLVEQLSQSEAESGGSQGKAEGTPEGSTPTDPDVQDAQLTVKRPTDIVFATQPEANIHQSLERKLGILDACIGRSTALRGSFGLPLAPSGFCLRL